MKNSDEADGGRAFERLAGDHAYYSGMTLRDWFAGQALSAMMFTASDTLLMPGPRSAADWAYAVADAMLTERSKAPAPDSKGTH